MKLSIWQYTSLALGIIIILLAGCNSCQKKKIAKLQYDCDQKLVKADTVIIVTHDTVPFSTIVYVPQPYRVDIPTPVYIDTGSVIEFKGECDEDAIRNYNSTAYYSDNQKIKDSSGREVGEVTIKDQIHRNRISQRQVFGNIVHDSVTSFITNTIEAKKKNALYGGLLVQNNAVGGSVLFLQKKGWGFEAGALIGKDGKLIYQGSFKKRLSK